MFIKVQIRNVKKDEMIMFVVENNQQTKLVCSTYAQQAPKKAIKAKLRNYVNTDVALTPEQSLHAFGWTAAFLRQSKLFQNSSNLEVAWTFHDTAEDLNRHTLEMHNKLMNNGSKVVFKETA